MNWKNTATWVGVAALIGGLVAAILPANADMLAGYGEVVQGIATGIAAAAAAFVVAARKKT